MLQRLPWPPVSRPGERVAKWENVRLANPESRQGRCAAIGGHSSTAWCLPITARVQMPGAILPESSPTRLSGYAGTSNAAPVLGLCDVLGDLSNSLSGCGRLDRAAAPRDLATS